MSRRSAPLVIALIAALAAVPAVSRAADEQQIGANEYAALEAKGEILPVSDPLYAVLDPIAARIAAVADPQYAYPFRFVLVHEDDPNAFAVPGGNVYVTDSLMRFVADRDELAGVLCHETSHDIHHDVENEARREQPVASGAAILSTLIGHGTNGFANGLLGLGETMQFDHYSRDVETAADLKGADTCAEAGFDPWGLVWLFRRFENGDGGDMEVLSDHPSDSRRIADLEAHLRSNPQLFGGYSSDPASATPLSLPSATRD